MKSAAQIKATNKYDKINYDRIVILLPKGQKATLQDIATRHNLSLSSFVKIAIAEKLQRLNADNDRVRKDLIKVLSLILARKKAIQYQDFLSGITQMLQSASNTVEPEEGHNNSSADTLH